VATRASFSFWVGPGGRAGCWTGLAAGGGATTGGGAAADGWGALLAGAWAWGAAAGGKICARGLSRKARYCSLVSFGGVDTAKSGDGAGKKGIEN